MPDHAQSDDPAVQHQLNRLTMLSPGRDVLGLERIEALMARLGDPHRALPPVFHVAGTNGKGSTCAFLRAAIEAAGLSCHVYTSPHLVRFNERIRVAGALIDDTALAPLLSEVLDCSQDIAPSFFEATTAAAFLAFSRTPADAAIIEVGLGGRLDATNVIERPAVCGIAQLGIDHEAFLLAPEAGTPGDPLARIAFEKAGIAKRGVPLVTMRYADQPARAIAAVADATGAHWLPRGGDWDSTIYRDMLGYRDAKGKLKLPLPVLPGAHQAENAALAIAMLRHQSAITIPDAALCPAMGWAHWPARMQRLAPGPLTALLPKGSAIWLDGCHNPAGAQMLANEVAKLGKPDFITSILANKDAEGILAPLLPHASSFTAIPVPGHDHHHPEELARLARDQGLADVSTASDVEAALRQLAASGQLRTVLIIGTLYQAGIVLKANNQLPD